MFTVTSLEDWTSVWHIIDTQKRFIKWMKESKCKMVNFENTKIKEKKKDSKCLQRKNCELDLHYMWWEIPSGAKFHILREINFENKIL